MFLKIALTGVILMVFVAVTMLIIETIFNELQIILEKD